MKRLFTLIPTLLCASALFLASCGKEEGGTPVTYVKGSYTLGQKTLDANYCYYAKNPTGNYTDHLLVLTPSAVTEDNIYNFDVLMNNYVFIAFPDDRFGETVVFDGSDTGNEVYFELRTDNRYYYGRSSSLDEIDGGSVKVTNRGEGLYRLEVDLVMEDGKAVRCTLDGLFRAKSFDPIPPPAPTSR